MCGCEEFTSIPIFKEDSSGGQRVDENMVAVQSSLFTVRFGEGGSLQDHVAARVCSNCGHIDFFTVTPARRAKHNQEKLLPLIEEVEKKLNALKTRYSFEDLAKEQQEVTKELKAISAKLKSDEITIREQKELQKTSSKLNERLNNLTLAGRAMKPLEERLEYLQKLYSRAGEFELEVTTGNNRVWF